MGTPQRIQRKRTKGFKLPDNTVCVNRPTKYGNPFIVGKEISESWYDVFYTIDKGAFFDSGRNGVVVPDNQTAVLLFERYIDYILTPSEIEKLKGKNLSCFCSLDKHCHADVLLKIANY